MCLTYTMLPIIPAPDATSGPKVTTVGNCACRAAVSALSAQLRASRWHVCSAAFLSATNEEMQFFVRRVAPIRNAGGHGWLVKLPGE